MSVKPSFRAMRTAWIVVVALAFGVGRADATLQLDTKHIQRAVGFFYGSDASGHPNPTAELGTGFLLHIPSAQKMGAFHVVLVTARHVVDPVWACDGPVNPDFLFFRVNRRVPVNGISVEYIKIQLTNEGRRLWSHHSDDAVDVAVIQVTTEQFQPQTNDVEPIRFRDLATQEELDSLEIGDAVVSAGLVPQLFARSAKNVAFFKFGNISAIGEEEVQRPCRLGRGSRQARLWFLSGIFIPGNSGSPIFLNPGLAGVSFSNARPMVIGLISGSVEGAAIGAVTSSQRIFEAVESAHVSDVDLSRGR
ncbi:MAG: serine protease [Acidobacteriia bacterium]|nr:serine protease [Terriglobia bacterium]